jgi:predicted cupin superfamily sugar epimerase
MRMPSPAAEMIGLLDLSPHPEGGWYRETFRDSRRIEGGRAASTAIYFLLARDEVSHWHRVDAAEIWLWHAGAALALSVFGDAGAGGLRTHRLGIDLRAGERPQAVVPAGAWQSARSLGEWTLLSCTVAPGFEFAGFEMAPPGWQPPATPTARD